jgi:hypothetical protein
MRSPQLQWRDRLILTTSTKQQSKKAAQSNAIKNASTTNAQNPRTHALNGA